MADPIWTHVDTRTGSVTGTQDITADGVQGTPLAGLFACNLDGDPTDHRRTIVGFTDGTKEFALSWSSDTGEAISRVSRELKELSVHVKPRASTPVRSAAFSAFLSSPNGIRLNWDPVAEDSDGTGVYKISTAFFGGSAMQVHCDTFTSSATLDGTVDVTAPGVQSDLVFFLTGDSALSVNKGDLESCLGVYVRSPLANLCHVAWHTNSLATMAPFGIFRNNRAGQATRSDKIPQGAIECSAHASGFTATTRGVGDAVIYGYLAISFGGRVRVHAEQYDTPGATGDDRVTSPGWRPQFLMTHQTRAVTLNPDPGETDEFSGIGLFDGKTTVAHGGSEEDAVATGNAQGHYSSSAYVNQTTGTGAASNKATVSKFNPDGYTLNYSAADATVRRYWTLAIEEVPFLGLFQRRRDFSAPQLLRLREPFPVELFEAPPPPAPAFPPELLPRVSRLVPQVLAPRLRFPVELLPPPAPAPAFGPELFPVVTRFVPSAILARAPRLEPFLIPSVITACTSGTWSATVSFSPCDSFRIEIDGPSAVDVKVSATLELEEP